MGFSNSPVLPQESDSSPAGKEMEGWACFSPSSCFHVLLFWPISLWRGAGRKACKVPGGIGSLWGNVTSCPVHMRKGLHLPPHSRGRTAVLGRALSLKVDPWDLSRYPSLDRKMQCCLKNAARQRAPPGEEQDCSQVRQNTKIARQKLTNRKETPERRARQPTVMLTTCISSISQEQEEATGKHSAPTFPALTARQGLDHTWKHSDL